MKDFLKNISQIERETLEEIFRKFGCSDTPFLDDVVVTDPDFCDPKDFLTDEGAKAYDALIELIYGLEKVVYGFETNWVIEEINRVISCR